MASNLVIVESPAKAKTIEKYLGKDFKVLASYGHVRDLVPKEGAVNPEQDFQMKYRVIEKNEKHVEAISKALKKAQALYLATDPDREGEAISWHLHELLKERELVNGKPVHRIVFNEVTKNAIREAIDNPRDLSSELINAQQARRALDYLVGFNLSPLLWKKIMPKLSAGRVQSPALRLIVEREAEIEAFVPREYWSIEADVAKGKAKFMAKLADFDGEKVEQFTVTNEDQAESIRKAIEDAAEGKLNVKKVQKKQRKRNPTAPFITSTLQQEASRKLGFGAQRTMRVAQRLYEAGHITYMRTDSVALAVEATADIRGVIESRYGKENLPEQPVTYKTKSKNAQEAHEAIRPTSASQHPEE
ncbi:MAG: type I DNA topoisomerase, partial [Pseudomonadota bacterium]